MRYSKERIANIANDLILSDNVNNNITYDWIDVIGIPQRPQDLRNSLYLTTHSDGSDGWHNAFDRRTNAEKVAQSTGWHLAVEKDTPAAGTEHLLVESLTELASRLYEETRNQTDPYVIGVTGSVGKTTTVAFFEHLIKTAGFDVVRFWSKRITPLSLQCHYINRVGKNTQFVVMEYSAYERDHVAELTRVLPPGIAFLTNIYDTHINPGGFQDKHDIFDSKRRIRQTAISAFVNQAVLDSLSLSAPAGWQPFTVDQNLSGTNLLLPPTLRTSELHTVGRKLAEDIGIPFRTFVQAFETFVPQEGRITTCNYNSKPLFFDGEATYGSRQWSWFETIDDSTPTMLVESVHFGIEDTNTQTNLLERIFGSGSTFVLDTPENRERIPVNANFVSTIKFGELLKANSGSYLVYHKALATRDTNFDPTQYLNSRW